MADDEREDYRSMIHGHEVHTDEDDRGSRRYLRGLDNDEARTIFREAKVHGNAEFETRSPNGARTNYSAGYKSGRYTVTDEGKEKPKSSWF